MATYYILTSEVRGVRVPIGKVHLLRRDAEIAAHTINSALPGLRARVIEVAGDALDSEPELIRDHVRQFLAARG